MRAVAAQFLQKLDDLGELVLAQDRQFESQSVAMGVELVLVLLGDEHEHDHEQREQSHRSLQPRKRGRVERLRSQGARDQISADPSNHAEQNERKEPRPGHERGDPVHRALRRCGAAAVIGMQLRNRTHRLVDVIRNA
jgi:hypothetical protein